MNPPNHRRFRIQKQRAIDETLGDETIVLNLEAGAYYSINHTGTLIWKGVDLSLSIAEIVEGLNNRYPDTDGIEEEVVRFIEFVRGESLIEEISEQIPARDDYPVLLAAESKPYVRPLIEKYEDMAAALLADPIHEVEADGWPKLKKT